MPTIIRTPPQEARAFLAGARLFRGLDDHALDEALRRVQWMQVAGGEILFRRGEPGDALYLVVTGRLQAVLEEESGVSRVVREVGRGENVGELALLTAEPRTATVRAIRDSEVVRLSKEDFDHLLCAHPTAMLRLVEMLAEWVARSTDPRPVSSVPVTIALVPLHSGARTAEAAAALARELDALGTAVHLTPARLDAELGAGHSDADQGSSEYARTTAWLDGLETSHRFVVYEASPAPSRWARRCIRQADRILLIAEDGAALDSSAQESAQWLDEIERSPARTELVLIHRSAAAERTGASRWLGRSGFSSHHHLDLAVRADVERLVRRVTGKAVGLVLSGGGARGFAHIGVIRALRDAGIPVDRVGGTSMGAVIGAQLACGFDDREMLEINRAWAANNPLWDLTLPVVSLVSGRAGTRILQKMFGDRCIEDLRLDYFCVTTNLTRSRIEVHTQGPLVRWVGASISIPGIAPPTRSDSGDMLVDGGVLNNLPVDVMRERGEGPVIAVDVAPVEELSLRTRTGEGPSPWRLLASRLNPFASDAGIPGIYKILERSTLVASLAHAERAQRSVALHLAPPVAGFGVFDWRQVDRLAALGFEFARRRIDAWKEEGSGL